MVYKLGFGTEDGRKAATQRIYMEWVGFDEELFTETAFCFAIIVTFCNICKECCGHMGIDGES